MSWHRIFVAPCPRCRKDVAAPRRRPEGGWRVTCDPAHWGCGAAGDLAVSDAAAVQLWNDAARAAGRRVGP